MSHSWGVVMTVREPAQLVLANVGWHIATGASEVFVYLDDPGDPVAETLCFLPKVHVIRCEDAHWARLAQNGLRPESINRRQGLNAVHAMRRTQCDWIVHIDADEFLWQDRPLAEEMAVVWELDCELHFPVHERVFLTGDDRDDIFAGVFRTTANALNRRKDGKINDKVIFGEQLPVLHHGVLGHAAGKCAAPTDSDFRIGLHWSFRGNRRNRAERYHSTSTRLLHFDGLTPLHWLSKLIRYHDVDPEVLKVPPHRRAQIEIFQDVKDDPEALREFHSELREPNPDALSRLRAFGLIQDLSFDPKETLRQVLPDLPDLSSAAFDAELRKRIPGLPAGI